MKLLVVICCYKVPDLTIDCLRSLASEIPRTPGARVTVCENGTGGDSASRIQDAIDHNGWADWVDLVEIFPNRGFTGGNNHVIRPSLESHEPPEYVHLLNADTVVQENALSALVAFMDAHPKAGIAGSKLFGLDGAVQASAFRFLGVPASFDLGLRLGLVSRLLSPWSLVPPHPNGTARVDWVPGASMILRRSMLEQIGFLDEGLYTYFDDIDICLRAKRAGWETWYVEESRVTHLEGASTDIHRRAVKRRPAYWFQARRRFFLKNHGPFYSALVDAAFLTGFAGWRLRRAIQRKPDPDPPQFLGDFFRHSVFRAGFRVEEVPNPALVDSVQNSARAEGAGSPVT
jgi:GT2 family glycosyltransferase